MPYVMRLPTATGGDGAYGFTPLWLWHFNTNGLDTTGANAWTSGGGGAVTIDSTIKRFGAGSLLVSASQFAPLIDMTAMLAGSWTIEYYVRGPGNSVSELVEAGGFIDVAVNQVTDSVTWLLKTTAGANIVNATISPVTIPADVFTHVAIVRNQAAGTYSLFFNGARLAIVSSSSNTVLGGNPSGDRFAQQGATVYLDELRYVGAAVYDGESYQVPLAEFS